MANIPIWPGSASFSPGSSTAFSFYDSDPEFAADAPNVAIWCAQRLGYPLVDVELQDVNFFTCFEEAVSEYGAQVYHAQIVNNLYRIKGTTTGSTLNQIHLDLINYGNNLGNNNTGGGNSYNFTNARLYSASLEVRTGVQKYNLVTDPSIAFELSGSAIQSGDKNIVIKRVYHYAPAAINRYFDPYAGTGTGIQSLMQSFGFGNYSPGVNFMLMPIYFDTLKLQAIEFNDTIRKSAYHFEINGGRFLKLFPIPNRDYRLWFEYTMGDDSVDTTLDPTTNDPLPTHLVTDISNAPYERPIYAYINEPGRQWIRKYCLALAKEMLGSIRGKYQTVPIPGSDTTLDYTRLLGEAAAEKTALIEELKALLESTSTLAQGTRETDEADKRRELNSIDNPYQIYIH